MKTLKRQFRRFAQAGGAAVRGYVIYGSKAGETLNRIVITASPYIGNQSLQKGAENTEGSKSGF